MRPGNVYVVDVLEVVFVIVSFEDVSVATNEYPVRVEPPLSAGAVHSREAEVELPVTEAITEVGAPAVVYGVMLLDADEDVPVPAELVAATLKVYDVP